MPVTYAFDQESCLIHTRCTGQVTFQEVMAHFRQLESDSARPPRLHVLLDLSQQQTEPTREQLWSVVAEVERLRDKVRWGACAIVASRDVLFGVGRMFQAFTGAYFSDSNVFRDLEQAEHWLASIRPSAA
jgi:hypothetical protein